MWLRAKARLLPACRRPAGSCGSQQIEHAGRLAQMVVVRLGWWRGARCRLGSSSCSSGRMSPGTISTVGHHWVLRKSHVLSELCTQHSTSRNKSFWSPSWGFCCSRGKRLQRITAFGHKMRGSSHSGHLTAALCWQTLLVPGLTLTELSTDFTSKMLQTFVNKKSSDVSWKSFSFFVPGTVVNASCLCTRSAVAF